MNMDNEAYKKYVEARAKKSPIFKNCAAAFLVGGIICVIGHVLMSVYEKCLGVPEETASPLTSVSLIFIAVLLTGIGVFDKIASFAGAGTLVPITGFANAVSSPAIDSKTEGFVLGVGAKIFSIAGPVILYGISSGVIYGIIYRICTLF